MGVWPAAADKSCLSLPHHANHYKNPLQLVSFDLEKAFDRVAPHYSAGSLGMVTPQECQVGILGKTVEFTVAETLAKIETKHIKH
jgi:hypothetical protein